MAAKNAGEGGLDRLYSFLMEEEDARVCKDIPEGACKEVPGNFFKITASQSLSKLADELANAKTVLPWLLSALGAPGFWIGFLVPIRESGSLLPQLVIAGFVRARSIRKHVWLLGAVLQAAALAGMGAAAFLLEGGAAGVAVVSCLGFFSLARGLASVASKDVKGKTVPRTRRGRLTGITTAISGGLTILTGAVLTWTVPEDPSARLTGFIVLAGAVLWILAAGVYSTIHEEPGATEGGAHAIKEAFQRLSLLRNDAVFRRFITARALLISTALAAPYYVALGHEQEAQRGSSLSVFILASGLASAVSSFFWGRYSDKSSRSVLMAAGAAASSLGLVVFALSVFGLVARASWIAPLGFFLLSIAHGGVRIGRKTYVLDMATGNRRTDYVAVGNTVIGAALVLSGALGFLTPVVGSGGMLLILSLMGFGGVLAGRGLPEVQ